MIRNSSALVAVLLGGGALALGGASVAAAGPGPLWPAVLSQHPGGGVLIHAMERLDLSVDQRLQLRNILASHREQLAAEVAAVRSARSTLFDAIHSESHDEALVREASAEVATAEAELAVSRSVLVHELREVLTEEQRAEAAQMRETAKMLVGGLLDGIVPRVLGGVG